MLWFWKNDEQNSPPSDSTICSATEVDGGWRVRSWISAPKRLAGRVIRKPYKVYRVWRPKDDDDGATESLFTAVKLLKKCSVTFPFSYFLQENFSDRAVLILRGGFAVILAATPPTIREALCVDSFVEFNSNYIVPFLSFTNDWLRDNGPDMYACSKEALPALQTCGKNILVASKALWSKSQPIVALVSSEVQKLLSDREVKELLWNAAVDIQKKIRFTVETIYHRVPPEYVDYLAENKWILVNHIFNLLKHILKLIVASIPIAIAYIQNVCATSAKLYVGVARAIILFLERNPELCRGVKNVCVKIVALLNNSAISTTELLPVLYDVIKTCICQALKVCKIMLLFLQAFFDAHGIVLKELAGRTIQILIPLILSAFQKILSRDTQLIISDNLPMVLDITSKTNAGVGAVVKHSFLTSRFVCYKLYEYEPAIYACSKDIIKYYGHVFLEVTSGVLLALYDLSPIVFSSLMEALPVLNSGLAVVGTDLQAAVSVMSPTIIAAVQEISKTTSTACFEIYPDILALSGIYFDLLSASYVVAPVVFHATTELLDSIIQALRVIAPAMQKSFSVVVPAAFTAASISVPVILSASCNFSSALKTAVMVFCRELNIARAEVLSTSLKGVSAVSRDIVDASCEVSANRKLLFKKSLIGYNALHIASSAVSEINSLLWILYCLDVTNEGLELTSRKHPFDSFESRNVVYFIFRKSGYVLAVPFGTILFCNICFLKGNSYVISTVCEIKVRLSRYYDSIEPRFSDSIVMFQMFLKSAFSSETNDSLESFAKVRWYQSLDIWNRVSTCLPENTLSLQHFARMYCNVCFDIVAKCCSVSWNICVATSPRFWSFLKIVSPQIWSIVCDITPRVWSYYCTVNRRSWTQIRQVSPQLWCRYSKICIASWKILLVIVPKVWKTLNEFSPEIWSLTCQTLELLWIHLCSVSPPVWAAICDHVPILWNHICNISNTAWMKYRYVVSKLWKVLCLSTKFNWEINRYLAIKLWEALVVQDSTLNQVLGNFNSLIKSLLHLCDDVWFVFCSIMIVLLVIRHYNAMAGMFAVPDCESPETSAENASNLSLQMSQSTASQAFQAIRKEVTNVKTFLTLARLKVHHHFSSVQNVNNDIVQSEVASTDRTTSPTNLLRDKQQSYVNTIMKNVINSIRQSPDYISLSLM